ncbi:MAG: C69 family dipeptidase [Gammaproteobacteria bacterium]|nr:C69 family dipeptidase [Gammaproteobacteria bacterium]
MSCTTILVGKKASYNNSTMIARNDDSPSGVFHVKKMALNKLGKSRKYKSVISHLEITTTAQSYPYTTMPNVDPKEGIWAAAGINSNNVSVTATETITTNERVLGADPYVEYKKDPKGKEYPGGIGEEDIVELVLPYIKSAREGVIRLGRLLAKYGTYESNGIAFSDKDEIWWLETIGGHHFLAKRVEDDEVVIMPNQLGMDSFDFEDAYSKKINHICSDDMLDFIKENNLDLSLDGKFNPRDSFGSHSDSDHTYNTPRAWYMARYFLDHKDFDFPESKYQPSSDDIPFSIKPNRKVTIEDVKYLLSSHYQGTPYDPYNNKGDASKKGIFRPIGVNRTSFMSLSEIRDNGDQNTSAIEWICFSSNVYNALVPLYTNVSKLPEYYTNTTLTPSTDNFYWINRIIAALCDPHFKEAIIHIERYQEKLGGQLYSLIKKYDQLALKNKENASSILEEANEEIAKVVKEETNKCLNNVLYTSSLLMKNGFSRSDN